MLIHIRSRLARLASPAEAPSGTTLVLAIVALCLLIALAAARRPSDTDVAQMTISQTGP